jgi:hypothetical protein
MAQLFPGMKATRYRSAWVLLTVAVMMAAVVTRVETGARGKAANSVIEFLAGHPNADNLAATDVARLLKDWSARQARAAAHSRSAGVWQAILPVFFIGLVVPLCLAFVRVCSATYVSAAPFLPSSFQRPPPAWLA